MSDRDRAISILHNARRILVDRLTARILQSQDEIMDDAEGGTYTSELESVYDEICVRLAHIHGLLSNLPPDSPPGRATSNSVPAPNDEAVPVAEAAAAVAEAEPTSPGELVSFPLFVRQMADGDSDRAAACLAELLNVDHGRARRCVATFRARLTLQPDILKKAMKLRTLLEDGQINDSLMLLWECFGLQGPESILALRALQSRLGN